MSEEADKVLAIYQAIISEYLDKVDSIELISIAAQKEGWHIALENTTNPHAECHGLIIGKEDWIEDHTLDMENFDIWTTDEDEYYD